MPPRLSEGWVIFRVSLGAIIALACILAIGGITLRAAHRVTNPPPPPTTVPTSIGGAPLADNWTADTPTAYGRWLEVTHVHSRFNVH